MQGNHIQLTTGVNNKYNINQQIAFIQLRQNQQLQRASYKYLIDIKA